MYLISACLCGVNCKYNGKNNLNEKCLKLLREGKAVVVCPEQLGGLTTPRIPSEIIGDPKGIVENNSGQVLDKKGNNISSQFVKGAKEALKIAKECGIKKAILKEGSPSCGSSFIYDGSFSGKKVKGEGVTTYLLRREGIEVISEEGFNKEDLK